MKIKLLSALLSASLFLTLFGTEAIPTEGVASWYGEELEGEMMANGEPFDPEKLTCASWFYPLGTRLEVWHRRGEGWRCVVVEVTDRGPSKKLVKEGRIIDLSKAAFSRLGDLDKGLIQVEIVKEEEWDMW